MCKVRTGEKVKSYEDIRNIITGLILRQEGKYREEDILRMVYFYTQGANMVLSQVKICNLIRDSLDFYTRYDLVLCQNGYYTSKNASYVLANYCLSNNFS